MTQTRVLGVRVDCLDMPATLDRIDELVQAGGPHLVATVNPEFIMTARRHGEFARVLESADLCLPDGTGVVWAARRQGCSRSSVKTSCQLGQAVAAQSRLAAAIA